jgi:hypothetical protein
LLTAIHLPVSIALKAELQKAVLGIVALAALGTLQVTAPSWALPIVVLGDRKGCAATAGHEIELEALFGVSIHAGF